MTAGDSATVTAIYRYPVKGLSAEQLDSASIRPGCCIANDRIYAIENGGREFDPEHPCHMSKIKFLMLMRNERLASLQTRAVDDGDQDVLHAAGL